MNCIDVLRVQITTFQLQEARFFLFEHFVGINWRVRNETVRSKIDDLDQGLKHYLPKRSWSLLGNEILSENFRPNKLVSHGSHVISIASKVKLGGEERHLAMMNLHPESAVKDAEVPTILSSITGNMSGYLLETGRFYHFYGLVLQDETQWLRFLAQFLMPTVIVSPRYIGHSLYRGYTALRITTDDRYKPVLPVVSETL